MHVRVCGKPRAHHYQGGASDDRRRQPHHQRDKKRVQESRRLPQGFHVPEFVRLDAQTIHGKVVVQRQLDAEKYAY